MFKFVRTLLGTDNSAEAIRRKLLDKYPNHLDLIDSREIPHEYSTGPDLTYYTESAEYYYNLILESAPLLKDKARPVTLDEKYAVSNASNRIVNASWGLIACGAQGIPYAVKLLQSKDRDLREAASSVFCGLRDGERLPGIIEQIVATLTNEDDRQVIDSLLVALGNLRSREALPAISRIILNPHEEADTRHTAAISLGHIVRQRFEKRGGDPVELACQWLTDNGYTLT